MNRKPCTKTVASTELTMDIEKFGVCSCVYILRMHNMTMTFEVYCTDIWYVALLLNVALRLSKTLSLHYCLKQSETKMFTLDTDQSAKFIADTVSSTLQERYRGTDRPSFAKPKSFNSKKCWEPVRNFLRKSLNCGKILLLAWRTFFF